MHLDQRRAALPSEPTQARLRVEEHSLLQVTKLHDRAFFGKDANLTIDYVVNHGEWSEPVLSRLRELSARLDGFATKLRTARNKTLSHIDLGAVLANRQLGAFEKDQDIPYFKALQEFVNIVHSEVAGTPWPFRQHVKDDVAALLNAIKP